MHPANNGVRRNPEIEEATNLYFIHPLSARLVPFFARAGVHPNTVSIMGALCGIAAGIAYYENLVFLGFALMVAWHVFDGADGQLARLTNKMTPSGQVIDGLCDYASFGAIYVAIALHLRPTYGHSAWLLVVLAAASHAIQAAGFERQREIYLSWNKKANAATGQTQAPMPSSTSAVMCCYEWIQQLFMPLPKALFNDLNARAARGETSEIGACYREIYRRPVKLWSLLSANNRTIAIFAAFVLGHPAAYPWAEIVVLNFALAALIQVNAAAAKRLAAQVAAAAQPN